MAAFLGTELYDQGSYLGTAATLQATGTGSAASTDESTSLAMMMAFAAYGMESTSTAAKPKAVKTA